MAREDDRVSIIIQELVRRSNDDSSRLRVLEQRLQSLEERIASFEETGLERVKKFNKKIFEIDARLMELGNDIARLINSTEKINKQINTFARRREIKEIEKMFELLSPIKQEFVTREELEKELGRA